MATPMKKAAIPNKNIIPIKLAALEYQNIIKHKANAITIIISIARMLILNNL